MIVFTVLISHNPAIIARNIAVKSHFPASSQLTSSQRFHKSTTDAPGSGNYFPVNDMSDSGRYVLSNNRGQGRRRLDQEFRASFVNEPAKVTKSTSCAK